MLGVVGGDGCYFELNWLIILMINELLMRLLIKILIIKKAISYTLCNKRVVLIFNNFRNQRTWSCSRAFRKSLDWYFKRMPTCRWIKLSILRPLNYISRLTSRCTRLLSPHLDSSPPARNYPPPFFHRRIVYA